MVEETPQEPTPDETESTTGDDVDAYESHSLTADPPTGGGGTGGGITEPSGDDADPPTGGGGTGGGIT
jgi:hypothetical protein